MCLSGKISFLRRYYKCPKCGHRYFPYDDYLGIGSSMLSKRCAKAVTWLSIFMPYEHVREYCKDIMDLEISETCLKETAHRIGSKLHEDMDKKGKRPETANRPKKSPDIVYIQADGSMVPIRGEKEREFKEAKLGLAYSNEDIVHKKTKKGENTIDILNKRFVSSIGDGVEPFKKMMHVAAIEKGYFSAKQVVVLSDGAVWISKMRDEFFPRAIHILDWYHSVDHLWQTAHELFGETNLKKCEQWVLPLKELLWNGKVDEVVKHLEREAFSRKKNQTVIFKLRGYYVANREHMRYDQYRQNGFYIGSGAIESAHKYIVASRLKQAGMRWTISHASSMIWLRSKYFENNWNDFWLSMNLKDYLQPVKKVA
jgi:hypothetical protein